MWQVPLYYVLAFIACGNLMAEANVITLATVIEEYVVSWS